MVLQRCSMSLSILRVGLRSLGLSYRRRSFDGPSLRIVFLQVEFAAHPTENHGLRNRQLLGPQSKVDVHLDQGDQSDTREPVEHVKQAPGHVAEQIGIAWE